MQIQLRSLLLTVPALFTLACGEAPIEGLDADFEAAEPTAAQTLALAPTHSSSSSLADAVAAHPAFAPLSQRAHLRVSEMLEVKATMTVPELEASYSRLEHCRLVSSSLCSEEVLAIGIDPVITPYEIGLGQQLNEAFQLDGLSLPERTLLFRDAQLAYVANGGSAPPLSLVPGSFENGEVPCDQSCKSQILKDMDDAHAGTMARMASDNADDEGAGHPWWVEVGIAVGTLAIECLIDPDCYLWPFEKPPGNEPECNDDGDCGTGEYCWKGPLGIGENECRDKKKVGESCGSDRACKSGCCKFNLWDLGSTCRAASECD